MLILSDMWSRFSGEMLVIGASVDTEDPTEGLDIVLETELMDSI